MDNGIQDIKIYTAKRCIGCRALKLFLERMRIDYIEADIEDPYALEELYRENISDTSVPILKIGKDFYANVDIDDQIIGILKFHKLI